MWEVSGQVLGEPALPSLDRLTHRVLSTLEPLHFKPLQLGSHMAPPIK